MELLDFLTCLRLRVQRPPLARPPPVTLSALHMLVTPFLVFYLHNKVNIQAQLLSPPIYSYI